MGNTGNTGNAGKAGNAGNTEDQLRDYLKRVTTDLRKTRGRLTDLESRAHEPIAIVATACRMPGAVRTPRTCGR